MWTLAFLKTILELDDHIKALSESLGAWLYVVLFVVVFCETGLVVMPFLPGDSLFFAIGALAALSGSTISIPVMFAVLTAASITGNTVNYTIGRRLGPRVFRSETSRFLNRKHLARAQRYYAKHGGKTMILGQFLAIVRTFAPFVAGMGQMPFHRFIAFTVVGAVLWVSTFLGLGYWLGEWLKDDFHWVVIAIIAFAVVPMWFHQRSAKREEAEAAKAAATVGTTSGSGSGPADGERRVVDSSSGPVPDPLRRL